MKQLNFKTPLEFKSFSEIVYCGVTNSEARFCVFSRVTCAQEQPLNGVF